jgi:hypothetical protein
MKEPLFAMVVFCKNRIIMKNERSCAMFGKIAADVRGLSDIGRSLSRKTTIKSLPMIA